jgi:DNA mismatch repair ATPase MutS
MDMTRQMRFIKHQHPDVVLFFRHDADSFRAYNEDARVAWSATPAKTHSDVFSIAVHEAEAFIAKLVEMGHRVAICERTGR